MLTKIYTRTGDAGTTALVGGIRIAKDSVRLESYGTVDELSSHLGLLASLAPDSSDELERIQMMLFTVCSYLATDAQQTPQYVPDLSTLDDEITFLESRIDAIGATLPQLKSFILPGGTTAASQCHVCRTVCRRAERRIAALAHEADIDARVFKYVNRLSDYLFVLARHFNIISNVDEKIWKKTCKKE
jgi:cob(I)alamin adenosyltransferase